MSRAARTLDDLPLFATDDEIAVAVVGPKRANDYRRKIAQLEKMPGFPMIDPAHGGRYTPAIKAFYERRAGMARDAAPVTEDRPEDPLAWRSPRSRRRA